MKSIWINSARAEDHVAINTPAVYQRSHAFVDCESIFAADQKVKAPGLGARQLACGSWLMLRHATGIAVAELIRA